MRKKHTFLLKNPIFYQKTLKNPKISTQKPPFSHPKTHIFQAFISAAQAIQKSQKSDYSALISGEIREKRTVFAPKNANSDRISFEIGDACELNCEKLGEFDAILAANLLCRCVFFGIFGFFLILFFGFFYFRVISAYFGLFWHILAVFMAFLVGFDRFLPVFRLISAF
jgi:hypothetical protein